MTDRDPTRPTEHEERVAEEMDEEIDEARRPGTPSYAAEIEAERRGTTADEIEEEEAEDESTAPHVAYKPRTG